MHGRRPGVGVTGGRGRKGRIYEGGLRVPAILQWPKRITAPRTTNVPCNTSDIYPTLLEIAGVRMAKQPPLDGISLVSLIDGTMKTRPKPMGFWSHPTRGIRTPTRLWMADLLAAQRAGKEVDDPNRLRLEAGKLDRQYPKDHFPGHAAWLDWPWKLHRIENNKGVTFELYQFIEDPKESTDLSEKEPQRVAAMKGPLIAWLESVVDSLNGKDYA